MVLTTIAQKADADRVAKHLVERRLAGCVQVVGPISSTYWWQDEIEVAEEWLCLIKTGQSVYEEVEKAIIEVHPYETPEIIAVPVVAGSEGYLGWLESQLR